MYSRGSRSRCLQCTALLAASHKHGPSGHHVRFVRNPMQKTLFGSSRATCRYCAPVFSWVNCSAVKSRAATCLLRSRVKPCSWSPGFGKVAAMEAYVLRRVALSASWTARLLRSLDSNISEAPAPVAMPKTRKMRQRRMKMGWNMAKRSETGSCLP